jgi:predicted metal-binding membrane protein
LEKLQGIERAIVIGALAAITVLFWTYLIWIVLGMSPGMSESMPDTPGMVPGPWTIPEFWFVFAMWSAMMIGMMTPSIAPAILAYGRFSRARAPRSTPLGSIASFAVGYLFAWLGFAFIASVMQMALSQTGLLTPTLHSASDVLGGVVLILAGTFQLTMMKNACLSYCRSPQDFTNNQGAFGLGLRHGLYCIGCCWVLMLTLFVVGVMELLLVAVIATWILLEKTFPADGVIIAEWLSGGALITAGIGLLTYALL